MTAPDHMVYIVDDDDSVRNALSRLFRSVNMETTVFPSAAEFLEVKPTSCSSCILLDVRMPGLSGLDLQDEMGAHGLTMPIIFITGHATVPMSVQAMKAGAFDFIEKPFDDQTLINAVRCALELDERQKSEAKLLHTVEERIQLLTPREHEVFVLVVSGLLNKQIASKLGASEKTIKVHRARVMEKMGTKSLADLVRYAQFAGVFPSSSPSL